MALWHTSSAAPAKTRSRARVRATNPPFPTLSKRSQALGTLVLVQFQLNFMHSINALPFAMAQAGWLGGTIGLLLVGVLSAWTMRQIVMCIQRLRARMAREAGHKLEAGAVSHEDEDKMLGFR